MDGTLTVAVHDFPAIKTEIGIPLDQDILSSIEKMTDEEAQEALDKLHEIEFRLATQGKSSPGTIDLLNELEANQCCMGILTRNSFINTKETLRASQLEKFFPIEHIISRDMAKPKPSPEGIYILLDKWKASPNDAVMVGDYLFDLEAGNVAGLHTIYVDPTGEFIFQEKANHCIKQLNEILEIQ